MRRLFIGAIARIVGAVPVGRALDMTKAATGKIHLPDPQKSPALIRGKGTKFDKEAQVGGLLVLPPVNGTAASAEILEILGPEEIRLKKAFKSDDALNQLTGQNSNAEEGREANENQKQSGYFEGIEFKTAPKVDQTKVYDAVFERLDLGGCVGIFPEGGSHDRTELLPLKGAWLNVISYVQRLLTLTSWCRDYGSWVSGRKPEFWPQDYSMRHELFSCSQIQVASCCRVW